MNLCAYQEYPAEKVSVVIYIYIYIYIYYLHKCNTAPSRQEKIKKIFFYLNI